jgi:hypothetical protein
MSRKVVKTKTSAQSRAQVAQVAQAQTEIAQSFVKLRDDAKEKALIAAIANTGGVVSLVAKRLGVSWSTARKAIDASTVARALYEDEVETMIDIAESKLFERIQSGDSADIKWFLSRRAKHRGYVERVEIRLGVIDSQVVEWLRAGEITREDVIESFGESLAVELFRSAGIDATTS